MSSVTSNTSLEIPETGRKILPNAFDKTVTLFVSNGDNKSGYKIHGNICNFGMHFHLMVLAATHKSVAPIGSFSDVTGN